MNDLETDALHEQFALLRGAEQHKNALIEELLRRLDKVTQDFHQETLDHARESQYNREGQLRERQLNNDIRHLHSLMVRLLENERAMNPVVQTKKGAHFMESTERDPFVLVLIDGDGMIFEDQFIKKGESGGQEAAAILATATRDYVQRRNPSLAADYTIVTRIYANLKGLGDVCYRAGILDRPTIMDDFARGFTGSKQLFDFVDVGTGKDRADKKISENLKLQLYDYHCRHIFFGCSHDNGYARLLEDLGDLSANDRITLLEGVPFEKELTMLKSKYKTTKFDGLFRTSKINVYQQQYPPQLTPVQSQYQSPYQPVMTRPSPTPSSNPSSMNPMATSWATTAVSNATRIVSPPPTPQPTPVVVQTIPRNRHGQRIDPVVKYDANEVERVKKLKMCNVHFLRHDCIFGDDCTHDHAYKPNKNEVQTLRHVARMTPCKFGTECDEIKCIYGHR
ncbi:hypothetical protein MMC22_005111 [Lobaria immixta]|nr:hypothetical protein [Lobaria immixta]